MGYSLRMQLQSVRFRQRLARAIRFASWGLLVGSVAALACALLKYFVLPDLSSVLPIALAVLGASVGFAAALVWRLDWTLAAAAVDEHYTLKDRAVTALEFSANSHSSPLHRLALADAVEHLNRVNPRQVVPLRIPRVLPYAVTVCAVASLLVMFVAWNSPVNAGPVDPLEVAVAQADRMTEELKELEEFAAKEKDPEVEKLLQELKAAIEELKQPGTDMRKALATLSEMQAAVQMQQAKYNVAAIDAQLKAVGEALSLADPLNEAGQALVSGQYEKAAKQLENLEAPQLDRQTEKAIREKLEQAAKQMHSDGQNSLGAATGEMSQGLGGNGEKFSDGSKKLAGEARQQGKRKKLTDLLKRQCDCLSECKGECEGNCNSTAKNGKNKGGKKAGSGTSGGELGEQTPMFGNKNIESIKGKQSDEGESEFETTHAPEGSQQAQRDYRNTYAKYKKISDAVLESEPIPLGHRQTIRRYFESIRPNDSESDQVDESVKGR